MSALKNLKIRKRKSDLYISCTSREKVVELSQLFFFFHCHGTCLKTGIFNEVMKKCSGTKLSQ